jgi:hypothetical protein
MGLDADLGGAAPPKDCRLAFARSGWLGSAPLADGVWAGDQRTDLSPDDGLPTDRESFHGWTTLAAW